MTNNLLSGVSWEALGVYDFGSHIRPKRRMRGRAVHDNKIYNWDVGR